MGKLTPLQAEVLRVLEQDLCERIDLTHPYVYGTLLTEMSDESCREVLDHWEQKRERREREVAQMRLREERREREVTQRRLRGEGRWGNVLANAMDDD